MPAAITLTLDRDSSDHVRALWRALADAGLSASMPQLAYVAHVTLVVCPNAAAEMLASDLPALAAIAPPTVAAGTFGAAPAGVLWLGVVTTEALLALHARAAALGAGEVHPHYRTGAWMPHITLATDIAAGRMGEALERVVRGFVPFTARLASIEAVTFPPVRVLARQPLG
jgi:2'-5' RNA ligase